MKRRNFLRTIAFGLASSASIIGFSDGERDDVVKRSVWCHQCVDLQNVPAWQIQDAIAAVAAIADDVSNTNTSTLSIIAIGQSFVICRNLESNEYFLIET